MARARKVRSTGEIEEFTAERLSRDASAAWKAPSATGGRPAIGVNVPTGAIGATQRRGATEAGLEYERNMREWANLPPKTDVVPSPMVPGGPENPWGAARDVVPDEFLIPLSQHRGRFSYEDYAERNSGFVEWLEGWLDRAISEGDELLSSVIGSFGSSRELATRVASMMQRMMEPPSRPVTLPEQMAQSREGREVSMILNRWRNMR